MRILGGLLVILMACSAFALGADAKEFMSIARQLEPVHCEKRKLRRELAIAQAEGRDARVSELRGRFAALNRDPQTARLEKRLAELERRMTLDEEALDAISAQQRDAYYRCG